MAAQSIAGSQFTVTVGATDYSEQVLDGNINTKATISRRKTLAGVAYTKTDEVDTVQVSFLYDEEDGFFGAINTALRAGTGVAVIIEGGDAKWTGTIYGEELDVKWSADGEGEASGSFIGTLALSDVA